MGIRLSTTLVTAFSESQHFASSKAGVDQKKILSGESCKKNSVNLLGSAQRRARKQLFQISAGRIFSRASGTGPLPNFAMCGFSDDRVRHLGLRDRSRPALLEMPEVDSNEGT